MRQYLDRAKRRWSRSAGGFTLAELLISIGILGVGLTMSAALFPAGIAANRDSEDALLGTRICQNGLALAKGQLTINDISGAGYTDLSDRFSQADRQYPCGSGNNTGFFILGRQMTPGKNDYQLTIIAFRKQPGGGDISLKDAAGMSYKYQGTPSFKFSSGSEYAQIGAAILLTGSSGGSARIETLDGNQATLSNMLTERATRRAVVKILYQQGASSSPIIGTMTARTSLRKH